MEEIESSDGGVCFGLLHSSRSRSLAHWNSTSRPAASAGNVRSMGGTPGFSSTERMDARSMSSSAAAPASRKGQLRNRLRANLRKRSRPVYFTGLSGHGIQHCLGNKCERSLGADQAGG